MPADLQRTTSYQTGGPKEKHWEKGSIEKLLLAMPDFGPHATFFTTYFSATLAGLLGTQMTLPHRFSLYANLLKRPLF
jgi:hypothetical protein